VADPKSGASDEASEIGTELADPEAAGAIPSAALAAHAGMPGLATRAGADREIWQLAWPALVSQVLANAVSLIDIAMIGRLGTDALAAVGYATQFLFLAQSVLFAVGAACVALMARAMGAGDPAAARRGLAGSLVVASVVAVAVSAVALAVPGPLMTLLDAPHEIVALATPYFRLTLGSSVVLAVSLTFESAFRAVRDMRTPLAIAIGVTAAKTALNWVLIFGAFGLPPLDLVGAGLATLASQLLGLACFVFAVRRSPQRAVLAIGRGDLARSRTALGEVVRIAWPAVAERVVLNIAIMEYFALLGSYGAVAIAAYTVGVRLMAFSWIPGVAFSVASATLVGQALGAGDPTGAARAGWRAARLAVVVSSALGLLYALAREPLAAVFTSDAAVIAAMSPFMLLLALSQPLMGAHFTLAGALRGAGDTVTPLLAAGAGNWLFRVPISWLCARWLHTDVIWLWGALVVDHLARALWLLWAYRRGRWQRKR
jgi:putative MATE family efflux protein